MKGWSLILCKNVAVDENNNEEDFISINLMKYLELREYIYIALEVTFSGNLLSLLVSVM